MELIRGGMKAPIASGWVTTAGITGTGTGVVYSTTISVMLPDVDFYEAHVEVRFSHQRVNGTGFVNSWVRDSAGYFGATTENAPALLRYTTRVYRAAGSIERVVKLPIFSTIGSSDTSPAYRLGVGSVGTAAGTEWEVTDIKARIIYVPL